MNQKPTTPKTKPKAQPALRDLPPRTDAKGGNKTLGVTGSSTANSGKTGSNFKVEIEGIANTGSGNGI